MKYKDNIRIADYFFSDAMDLLLRYNITWDRFIPVKSRRIKAFIDLRISFECILKAYIAYFSNAGNERADVIKEVEKYGHRIDHLARDAMQSIPEHEMASVSSYVEELKQLPVGLRYKLDCFDFLEANEELYYRTVGVDRWMKELYECIKSLCSFLDKHLRSHSRIVTGEEIKELLLSPKHNKYLDK